jgi:hypothetical protein
MKRTLSRSLLASVAALAALMNVGPLFAGADPVSRRDAARLQAKIDRITKNSSAKLASGARTSISEAEVNSYLRYELGDRIPSGVKDPWVSILGENRLGARATVDMNEVARTRKSGNMLDPWNLVGGTLPLEVNGVLKTKNGIGTFAVESVSISGVPVPGFMLQEIVSYYSKSPTSPQGVALDKPFELPAGIREIQLARGQATIVQ